MTVQPPAVVPFDGDPHRLVRAFEEAYGSALLYRLPDADGSRRTLLADLRDTWRIHADGVRLDGAVFEGRIGELVESVFADADASPSGWAPDAAFVLAYDLTWYLYAEDGRPRPRTSGPHDALLGVVGPLRHRVVHDARSASLLCDPADAEQVRAVVRASAAAAAWASPAAGDALTVVLDPLDSARYATQVDRVHEHLVRGDVYQVLVSVPVRVRPLAGVHRYFAQIVHRYPDAEYAYWIGVDGVHVFGTCALPHLETDGDEVMTRVFAGTRPASEGGDEREAAGELLRSDPRYLAEHVMLVDLERNDLSPVSMAGTVAVDRFLEPLGIGPTTYLASDVTARAAPGVGLGDLLLATFPRGVTTGAPKYRAQQVLLDLEVSERRFYSGVVGVYDATQGTVRSNTIVTCGEQDGDEVVLRCGGGIVADSTADQELAELVLKLKFLV